jgi:hypothetical protein
MFTDANENLRIVGYFRGCGVVVGPVKHAEAIGSRPSQVDGAAVLLHHGVEYQWTRRLGCRPVCCDCPPLSDTRIGYLYCTGAVCGVPDLLVEWHVREPVVSGI